MDPAVPVKPARLTRSLLARSRQGALATLMPGSGDPYCSLVAVASLPDGSPILLISRLAVHTKNILNDARVSLMLDERAPGDPLEGARIMLAGIAEEAQDDDVEPLKRRYLAAHPSAEDFVGFKDFSFFRIRPSGVHLVAGFGRIVDLAPQDFLTELAGADTLIEAEAGTPNGHDLLSKLLAGQALFMNSQGKYDQAIRVAEQAISYGQASRRSASEALGQVCWGHALYRQGQAIEARDGEIHRRQ